jgi:DGQHR domain-containing protein
MTANVLKRRALRIDQHPSIPLYVFTLAAEEVSQVADVARISRDEAGKLIGYQRPEKKQHVKQILEYLDGEEVLFPNGLILAAVTGCAPAARWRFRCRIRPMPLVRRGSWTASNVAWRLRGRATPAWR